MPATPNGLVEYESSQNLFPLEALTSTDNITFTSNANLWSGKSGFAADVRPDGVKSGAVMTATAVNDQINYTTFTAFVNGADLTVAGSTATVTRASTDTHVINSLVCNSAGTVSFVSGAEDTAFSETRGANGGPPFIPIDSIELGQVRTTAQAVAVILASEIKQGPNSQKELALQPVFSIMNKDGAVKLVSALPLIHTGSVSKTVYAEYYEPEFAEITDSVDFVMPEETAAVNSTQVYGRTVSSASLSLGQGSFTALFQNGITDPILAESGETLWFRFRPDRFETENHVVQSVITVTRAFPADDNRSGAFTLTALAKGEDRATL